VAKARPRFARRGKFVVTYNSQETEEGRWLWEAKGQVGQCFEGPLHVICRFYMPRPKGHYGTGKNAGKLKSTAPLSHIKKPDVDNCLKFVLDCLNGIAWEDDCQIISLFGSKYYSDNPRTLIIIGKV
jgi:Holliday junction resolvase RusA-like endonuclease